MFLHRRNAESPGVVLTDETQINFAYADAAIAGETGIEVVVQHSEAISKRRGGIGESGCSKPAPMQSVKQTLSSSSTRAHLSLFRVCSQPRRWHSTGDISPLRLPRFRL